MPKVTEESRAMLDHKGLEAQKERKENNLLSGDGNEEAWVFEGFI